MQSLQAARDLKPQHVVEKADGHVQVQSIRALPQFKVYNVLFGEDDKMPSCECESWKLSLLPCKHMFATMINPPSHSWYKFPAMYRDSPYFSLDDNHKVPLEPACSQEEMPPTVESDVPMMVMEVGESASTSSADVSGIAAQLLKHKANRLTIASECRDSLSQIKNLTFLIAEETALKNLYVKLNEIIESLKDIADSEDGFLLEDTSRIQPEIVQKMQRKRSATVKISDSESKQYDQDMTTETGIIKQLPYQQQEKAAKRKFGQAYESKAAHVNVNLNIKSGLPGNFLSASNSWK